MRTSIFASRILERAFMPLQACQVRQISMRKAKSSKKSRKEAHVSTKVSRKFVKTKKKDLNFLLETEKKGEYLAEKPVDDVWISTYYPEPRYSFEEVIKRHKEYAQPDIFNSLHSKVYADMHLNLRTKKQTKFLSVIKNTIEVPHQFVTGVKRNVVLLCKEMSDVKIALKMGASKAGGPEIIKLIKDGVMKKTDFDHICATPDIAKEMMILRGPLKEEFPTTKNGKVNADVEKMLRFYLHGITYESVKLTDTLGRLQIPFGTLDMPVEFLQENFKHCVESINKHKPGGVQDDFITNLTIVAPPSPERFYVNPAEYSYVKEVQTVKPEDKPVEEIAV